jgi:O-antigen/teichoic acid export membrane protein/O-antigen ligase
MTALAAAEAPVIDLPDGGQRPDAKPAVRLDRRANIVKVFVGVGIWAMPLLVPAGPGNTAPADVFLAFAVIVAILWFSARSQLLRFPYVFPVGLSVLAGALASTVAYAGAYVSVGGGLITLLQDVFLLAWALSIANIGRDPKLLRTITRAWAISTPVWAAVMIFGVLAHISLLSGETPRDGVRAAFTLGDPNLAANYFMCSLLVLRATRYPRRRLLRWLCCALIVTAVVLTGSNGGAIVLILTAVLGGLFRMAKRRGAVPAVIAATVLALGTVVVLPHIHVQAIVAKAQSSSQLAQDSIGRQAESSGSRSTILGETIQLYLYDDNPIGLGPGGTKNAFQKNQFPYVKMAHDDYAAALVERGVLGGFALAFLLLMIGVRSRRIATWPLRPGFEEVIPRPELLGAAVVGMFISATLYQVLHFRHLWALLGIIAALDLFGRRQRKAGRPKAPEAVDKPMPGSGRAAAVRGGRHRSSAGGPIWSPRLLESADPPRRGPVRRLGARVAKAVPGVLTANVAARIVAIGALTAATILVAHAGGPKLLGELTLLRVLPGLAGVLIGCGLPSAVPYFLAGRDTAASPKVRATLLMLTMAGSLAAAGCWLALSPVLHRVFFHPWHIGVVLASTVPVFSQLWVAVGKSFLQGEHDMSGANWAIALEEAAFLPVYVALLPVLHGTGLLLTALVGADVLVAAGIAVRLVKRGFFKNWERPEWRLAMQICRYGLRGQIGGMLSLVNLRLDVAILGALVGPGTLGVYAVASKYAELLRLPGLAITYVLYPRLARRDRKEAGRDVANLLPRAFGMTALAAIPIAAAVPLLPLVYGQAFTGAMIPAYILLFGLLGEGVAGLVSAYLYGVGRPGANSLALGVSVVVTIGLDVALIPHYHAVGAAIASAVAYLTSSVALLACYFYVRKLVHVPVHRVSPAARAS